MQYELQFDLQKIALLRVGILFWEKEEVVNKVVEFFKTCDTFDSDRENRNKWGQLTKTLIDEWNKDLLPINVEIELMHIVKMLGETIFNWHQYIKYQYGLKEQAVNCINQICWTPYGTVDPVETFKSYWLNNPKLNVTKLYDFACNYVIRDCIEHLRNRISSGTPKNSDVIYEHSDQHISAYWHSYLCNFSREDVQEFNLIYNPNRSTEENMFRLSVHQGCYLVARYFWEKLTMKERDESVLKCARIAVLRNHHYYVNGYESIKNYKISQYIEICIFLINQMTEDQKKRFFNESVVKDEVEVDLFNYLDGKDEILYMLLSTWPWQELFVPILKDIIKYHDDYSKMQCEFLDGITDHMLEDHCLGYPLKISKYQELLHEVWLIIPTSVKKKMEPVTFGYDFVSNLISVWDLNSLKLILNDPATAVCRNEFIDLGSHSYDELIMENQFEKLNQFVEKMFQFEEDKKQFKKRRRDVLTNLISKGQFDLVDKFIDWQCSTPEEKQSIKNNLNNIKICEFFIRKQDYNLVNKFLDWKFDTEEEKRKCKDHFKNLRFSISQIYKIQKEWKQDIVRIKYECSRYLHWLWESEEEMKQAILVNLGCSELFMSSLLDLRNDDMMDNFIS